MKEDFLKTYSFKSFSESSQCLMAHVSRDCSHLAAGRTKAKLKKLALK